MDKNQLYRRIPKVDVLLEKDGIRKLEERYGRSCVKRVVQDELERVRILIGESVDETDVLKAVENCCIHRIYEVLLMERVLFYTRIWDEHHLIENMQKNWL